MALGRIHEPSSGLISIAAAVEMLLFPYVPVWSPSTFYYDKPCMSAFLYRLCIMYVHADPWPACHRWHQYQYRDMTPMGPFAQSNSNKQMGSYINIVTPNRSVFISFSVYKSKEFGNLKDFYGKLKQWGKMPTYSRSLLTGRLPMSFFFYGDLSLNFILPSFTLNLIYYHSFPHLCCLCPIRGEYFSTRVPPKAAPTL